ncbi:hypothetical protein [Embleya sp. NPDC050493]|uniref:hypothetical protein n=1 Tax=Embleya sp. NPDC050493 TaxID=3363989 RepID=UPI0037944554
MSRTAHHPTPRRWEAGSDRASGAPWRAVVRFDLRYSARVRAEAARLGRRPHPQRICRRVDVHAWGRYNTSDGALAAAATRAERRERSRLRASVAMLRALVNDRTGRGLDLDAADAVEIPAARHRRNELYQA